MVDRTLWGADPSFCLEEIHKADFIALRVDTSEDIFNVRPHGPMSLKDHFRTRVRRLQRAPEQRLPQRLGVCCAVWNAADRCFELTSYDLGLWPGNPLHMPAHVRSYIHKKASAKERADGRWEEYMSSTIVAILKALREVRVPIVVYDGLPDLLQLYDKFIADVPTDLGIFSDAWLRHFPAVFDIKWMALQDPPGDLPVPPGLASWRNGTDPSGQGVAALWWALRCSPALPGRGVLRLRFREHGPAPHWKAGSELDFALKKKGLGGLGTEGYLARMAMMVAETFLLLNDYRLPPLPKEGIQPKQAVKESRRELLKRFSEPTASTTAPGSGAPTLEPVSPARSCRGAAKTVQMAQDNDGGTSLKRKRSQTVDTDEDEEEEPRKLRRAPNLRDVRAIETAVDVLARRLVSQRTRHEIDEENGSAMHILQQCAFHCRHFRNRISAPGTSEGCIELDAAVVARALEEYENLEDL